MAKIKRQIIRIDEELCNGCGACVPSCKEGALRIVDGKARLFSDAFCDGLGACLGECPTGALTIEEREAEAFDEGKAMEQARPEGAREGAGEAAPLPCGCPGAMVRQLAPKASARGSALAAPGARMVSELRQWPIQLRLIPPNAPYLQRADLVVMADCTAFTSANVHRDFLRGRAVAIACPKLDETGPDLAKLAQMIRMNHFRSIEIVMMEVPCCGGLGALVERAIAMAAKEVPVARTIISLEGEILSREEAAGEAFAMG